MTTRKIAAENTGPVTIDAALFGHGGTITVRAAADCERATLTVHTADEEGAAADAVREATLRQSGTGLFVNVEGKGGASGGTTIITGGGRRTSVVQSFGTITGSVTGMTIVGGDVIVNGVRVNGNGGTTVINGSSPIEITATVPEGSSVIGRTQSADVIAEGAILNVTGNTQSGDVRAGHVAKVDASTQSGDVVVDRAAQITARTQSGDVRLGRTDVVEGNTMSGDIRIEDFGGTARLNTMSGDIRVHATAGGNLSARTMSGDVTVTATETAIGDNLDVQANSMSGRVRTPNAPSNTVRRRSY
ncbi:DUF4097 family beta strand repeat-containing protein [Streptomyces sp. NPDC101249]|uniref:DUF4097 family beta strand repeat-containing protein n=1 Tax=Streptomyces sp. NPDC101249 TaxID=3366140 RepID=UPI0037FBAF80